MRKMKMRYISNPQSIDIKPKGISRNMAVEFVMGELMELKALMGKIVYADDMLLSMVPFHKEQGAFLMCPANAQEEVKELVKKSGGFVSKKRSTEAVAEFLTKVYPKQRDKHKLVYSIFFDKDGVLWEEERLKENLPFFNVIAEYINSCQGPYTAHPPISIATGARRESTLRVLDYIKLNKENIPTRFHRQNPPFAWPPVIFEEGCLAFDPITRATLDLTEEKYGLFPVGFQRIVASINKIGSEIDKRVPEINKQIGFNCKIVHKERSGYTLDLPLEVRSSFKDLKKAHSIIYRNIRDLLVGDMEFTGLFAKEELEAEN